MSEQIKVGDWVSCTGYPPLLNIKANVEYKVLALSEEFGNVTIGIIPGTNFGKYQIMYYNAVWFKVSHHKANDYSKYKFKIDDIVKFKLSSVPGKLTYGYYYKVITINDRDRCVIIKNDSGDFGFFNTDCFELITSVTSLVVEGCSDLPYLDFTKPIKTRSGKSVEILTTKLHGPCSILCYLDGNLTERRYPKTGRIWSHKEDHEDLVNVPETIKVKPFYLFVDKNGHALASTNRCMGIDERYVSVIKMDIDKVELGRFDE